MWNGHQKLTYPHSDCSVQIRQSVRNKYEFYCAINNTSTSVNGLR